MKTFSISILIYSLLICTATAQRTDEKSLAVKVDSVLRLMTLDEKIGQLNQLSCDFSTGNLTEIIKNYGDEISRGRVGSFLKSNLNSSFCFTNQT